MQSLNSNCLYRLENIDGKLTQPLVELLRQLSLCGCCLGIHGIKSRKHIVGVKLDFSGPMGEKKMTHCSELVLLDVSAPELKKEGFLEPIFYKREEGKSLYLNILRCKTGRMLEIIPESGIYLWEVDHTDIKWPIVRVGSAEEVFRAISIIRQIKFNSKLEEWNRYQENFLSESITLNKLGLK